MTNSAKIAELNDRARTTFTGCRVMTTRGIQALGSDCIQDILKKVREFKDFNPNNDPFGERDLGLFYYNGHHILWKIDCYDHDLQMASLDPTDETITARVLTIMLAEEY